MKFVKGEEVLKEDGENLVMYECTYTDDEKVVLSLVKYDLCENEKLKKSGYGEQIIFHKIK